MKNLKLHHSPCQHFTDEKRMILQRLWNVNVARGKTSRLSIRAFARLHGVPYATMRRELLRGMAGKPFFDKIRREWFLPEYDASKACSDACAKNANKGAPMRFTNRHAEALQHQIVELGKSPAHARHCLVARGYADLPCVRSIYNHIDHGDIGILRGQTPYRPGPKRKRRAPVRKALKCPANLSIEERPEQVAQRAEFGHWEMDTMVSGVGGRGGLLVLCERMTRYVIPVKLASVTARAVTDALRGIIRSGELKTVRSITTDNGCEFLDSKALERLFKRVNTELKIYYTHAYAAWEKGSVENANRHIRRFFPKGTDFRRVNKRQTNQIRDLINSIPRLYSLNGKTAHESFNNAA